MLQIKEGTPAEKAWELTPPDLQQQILKQVESKGYIVRTTDDEKKYVSSQVQTEVDKAYSKHNSALDSSIAELSGVAKNSEEKTTDYLKRAVTEKLKVVKELETKIGEFEKKGVDTNQLAQEYKKRADELQQLVTTKEQEFNTKYTTLQTEMFGQKINGHVSQSLATIKPRLLDTIDKNLLEDIISARVARFNAENKAAEFEGNVIWQDPEKKTRQSKKDGKPLSTTEVLEGYFDDIIDKGKKGSGAGSGGKGGDGGAGSGGTWKDITVPGEVKSKVALHKFLSEDKKMDMNSKEFNEAYNNLGKDLPLQEKK